MSEETKHINIRSEEIQDILGRVPTFITRYGSMFVLFAILCILVVAGIVKYPDLVHGSLEMSSTHPPIPLYTKQAGNIEDILIQDGDSVSQNQLIAILENSATEADVFLIETKLDSFLKLSYNFESISFPSKTNLGGLQNSYAAFLSSLEAYLFFEKQNVGSNSIGHIQQQIGQLEQINIGLANQVSSCNNELQLLLKAFNSDLDLLTKGIVSQRDVDKSEANYIQKKSACESLNIQMSNNQLRIQELRMEVFSLSSQDQEGVQSKYSQVQENANKLKNEINIWKDQYLLIAPVAGFVSLNEIWSRQQYLDAEVEVLSIIQKDDSLKLMAFIPSKDIAKISLGQKVNIRFEAYNYMDFGLVQGKVKSIAVVPRDEQYQIEISLNQGLLSTYNKELNFKQGMKGSVEIVSEQRTVLSRIFNQFKYLISKKY